MPRRDLESAPPATPRTAHEELLRRLVEPHVQEASGWTDLAARLQGHGLQVESQAGRGAQDLVLRHPDGVVPLERLEIRAGELESRWGGYKPWREDLDKFHTALGALRQRDESLGRLEIESRRLEALQTRTRGVIETVESRNLLFQQLSPQLHQSLEKTYTPRALEAARARVLEGLARDGAEATALRLSIRPEAFGPLQGTKLLSWQSAERWASVQEAQRAAGTLRQLGELDRLSIGDPQRLAGAQKRNQKLAERLVAVYRERVAVPAERPILLEVSRLAQRLGVAPTMRYAERLPAAPPLEVAVGGRLGRQLSPATGVATLTRSIATPLAYVSQALALARSLQREAER